MNCSFIEDLNEQDKMTIKEQIQRMKLTYDKLDHLLPIFFSMTSNYEATRRIILMKYLLEDQFNYLPQDKYIIGLDKVYKLRDQLNGYISWIRNNIGINHPLQQQQQAQQHIAQQQLLQQNLMQQQFLLQQQQHQQQQQPQQQQQNKNNPALKHSSSIYFAL